MPDAGLRILFHTHLRQGIQWSSIETGLTTPGVPDSCGAGLPRGTFFVEHKRTDAWAVEVRPAQIGWMDSHIRHGGRCFVAVRRLTKAGPKRGPAADELWLISGRFIADLSARGLRGLPPAAVLGVWGGGSGRWDWDEVRLHLVG